MKKNIRTLRQKACTIANSLVKQGYSRSMAMVEAWIMVKLPQVITRVAGVTHAKRQTAIEHLQHYNAYEALTKTYISCIIADFILNFKTRSVFLWKTIQHRCRTHQTSNYL